LDSVKTKHISRVPRASNVEHHCSKRIWQWKIHYKNIQLRMVHGDTLHIHDAPDTG